MGTDPVGDLSERLVDALNAAYGKYPGHRAAHAKGVLCAATFTATPEAKAISRAPHFQGEPMRAHVRFSNGAGDPAIPDASRDARGMAVKVYFPDGSTTDVVTLTLPTFFVRTPEELIEFNTVRRPDPATGAPDMAKVGAFLEAHPETVPAVTAAITAPIPASYAQLTYHAIHAFRFVAPDGTSRAARYHFVPAAGEASISDEEAAGRPEHYLREELDKRFRDGPAIFHVDLELAAQGDPVDDPTAIWPDDRERVRVAELAITALAFDRERDGDILVFDPSRLADGIEPTGDKIFAARSGAYRVSVTRRTASG